MRKLHHWSARRVAGGLALAAAACGPSQAARLAADQVVTRVESLQAHQDQTTREAVRALSVICLAQIDARVATELERRRALLKVDVLQRIASKERELQALVVRELETALGPSLETMSQELEKERGRLAAGIGSKETEAVLAARFASTLTVVQREASRLEETIQARLGELRDRTLASIDQAPASRPAVSTQVDDLMREWEAGVSVPLRDAMGEAARELRRYVQLDSALALFAKGMLGDGTGGRLASLLETRAQAALSAVFVQADTFAKDRTRVFETDLDRTVAGLRR